MISHREVWKKNWKGKIKIRNNFYVRSLILRFPEDENRWKQWLDAIGETNEDVPSQLSLCSRHFSQACSAGLILMDNIVPISTLELPPTSSDSIAKAAKVDRSSPKIEPKTKRSPSPLLLGSLSSSIKRPIITK